MTVYEYYFTDENLFERTKHLSYLPKVTGLLSTGAGILIWGESNLGVYPLCNVAP